MEEPEALQTFKRFGFRWKVLAELPPDLIDRVMSEIQREDFREIAKTNRVRTVFVLRANGQTYYVKWHRFRGWRDCILGSLRGTRARREWLNLRHLRRHGLPAVRPVLLGVRHRCGIPTQSVLMTQAETGESLREADTGRTSSTDLARRVGKLIRQVHDAGLDCPDLHSENVLVSPNALHLLDLHAARRCGSVPASRRAANIAFLCNSFEAGQLTPSDRLRFLRAYLEAEPAPAPLRDMWHAVDSAAKNLCERHLRSRSRRCIVESTLFTRDRFRAGTVYRRRDFAAPDVIEAVERHRRVLAGAAPGEAAKRHHKTNVTLFRWEWDGEPVTLCVKEFVRPWICRLLPRPIRHRNALAAWKASLGLRVRNIEAPEALGTLLGRGVHSYVVMRAVESARKLDDYVRSELGRDAAPGDRRAFLRDAASAFQKLVDTGTAHDDLKATNVLVRENGNDRRFILLDLDAVRFPGWVPLEQKLLNLAQLSAALPLELSWADRLRFLRRLARHDARLNTRENIATIARLTRERTCTWQ